MKRYIGKRQIFLIEMGRLYMPYIHKERDRADGMVTTGTRPIYFLFLKSYSISLSPMLKRKEIYWQHTNICWSKWEDCSCPVQHSTWHRTPIFQKYPFSDLQKYPSSDLTSNPSPSNWVLSAPQLKCTANFDLVIPKLWFTSMSSFDSADTCKISQNKPRLEKYIWRTVFIKKWINWALMQPS